MHTKGKRSPEKVNSILERLVNKLNLRSKMKQYQVFEVWDSVVGIHIARQAQPQRINNMILWVNVSSSPWMQELEFMKHLIVDKLNRRIGETVVKDIRFRIGEVSR